MKLSPSQQRRFWREWSVACKVQSWDKAHSWTGAAVDAKRHELLERAGFSSLKDVDPLTGFDRVLAELAALSKPADIEPQLRAQEQPRKRLWWSIQKLGFQISTSELSDRTSTYVAAIMSDRFGTVDPDALTIEQLEQLRSTLANRLTAHLRRHREQLQTADTVPF